MDDWKEESIKNAGQKLARHSFLTVVFTLLQQRNRLFLLRKWDTPNHREYLQKPFLERCHHRDRLLLGRKYSHKFRTNTSS